LLYLFCGGGSVGGSGCGSDDIPEYLTPDEFVLEDEFELEREGEPYLNPIYIYIYIYISIKIKLIINIFIKLIVNKYITMNSFRFLLLCLILNKFFAQPSLYRDEEKIRHNEIKNLSEKKEIYTKFQLRGMHEKRQRQIDIETEKQIQNIIFEEHKNILNNVLKKAENGKKYLYFRILCGPANSLSSFDNHNILNTIICEDFFNKFNNTNKKENVILSVLKKLNNSFPDSNITSLKNLQSSENKINCNIYKISW